MLLYKAPGHKWIFEGHDLQEQKHFKTGIEVKTFNFIFNFFLKKSLQT